MKKILAIILILSMLFSGTAVYAAPQSPESAEGSITVYDLYLDGVYCDNGNLAHPVLLFGDSLYFPVSTERLDAEKDAAELYKKQLAAIRDGAESSELLREALCKGPSAEPSDDVFEASRAGFFSIDFVCGASGLTEPSPSLSMLLINLESLNGSCGNKDFTAEFLAEGILSEELTGEKSLARLSDGTLYASLEYLKAFGIADVYADGQGRAYISTDPEITAQRWADSDTNKSYSEGVAAYMLSLNKKKLNAETCAYYEYLLRHVAGQYEYITPQLLFAIVRNESNFEAGVGKKAIGLMQALLKYAQAKGYTKEMLKDPHINLEYGANYLAQMFKTFKGNTTNALAAYHWGAGATWAKLKKGEIKSNYVKVVNNYMSALNTWLSEHGYSTEFRDRLELSEEPAEQPSGAEDDVQSKASGL